MAYVYLIAEEPLKGEQTGPWTKIGYTKNPPEWRLGANLMRGNPRNLVVVEAFEYDTEQGARHAEKEAHAHFAAYLHQKEWFSLPASQISKWFVDAGAKRREGGI